MAKKKIKGLCVHDKHIDVDIPLDDMPFDILLGEELFCAVKHYQKRGIHMDNKVHIFIAKDKTNFKDIDVLNKDLKYEEYRVLLRKYRMDIERAKQSIKRLKQNKNTIKQLKKE